MFFEVFLCLSRENGFDLNGSVIRRIEERIENYEP